MLAAAEWPIVITKDGGHEVMPDARIPASLKADRHHLCVIGPGTPEVNEG